jgi:nitrite reductase/ring-hydroxylating ferredoxin subunit
MREVPPGKGKLVTMMGREIGLFNVDGRIEAIDNVCPHNQRPIGIDGISGGTLTCFWHNLTFDLESGFCAEAPHFRIRKYTVRIREDEIYVSPDAGV